MPRREGYTATVRLLRPRIPPRLRPSSSPSSPGTRRINAPCNSQPIRVTRGQDATPSFSLECSSTNRENRERGEGDNGRSVSKVDKGAKGVGRVKSGEERRREEEEIRRGRERERGGRGRSIRRYRDHRTVAPTLSASQCPRSPPNPRTGERGGGPRFFAPRFPTSFTAPPNRDTWPSPRREAEEKAADQHR